MPNMRDVAREAHAARKRCRDRGAPLTFFESDDGNGRNGWHVCELNYNGVNEHYGEINNYEEYWGNTQIFLGEDGMLYMHEFRGKDVGSARSGTGKREESTSHRVYKAEVHNLKDPLLAFKETKPYFMAVIDGLRALAR